MIEGPKKENIPSQKKELTPELIHKLVNEMPAAEFRTWIEQQEDAYRTDIARLEKEVADAGGDSPQTPYWGFYRKQLQTCKEAWNLLQTAKMLFEQREKLK